LFSNSRIFDDISLTDDQKAIAHMTKQMLENHTCVVGFYWRYGFNMPEFFEKMIKPAGKFDTIRDLEIWMN